MKTRKAEKVFGLKVNVEDGKLEKAMRLFKKKVEAVGLLKTLRDKEFYTKPSVERKLKRSAAKKRWQKKLEKESLPPKLY